MAGKRKTGKARDEAEERAEGAINRGERSVEVQGKKGIETQEIKKNGLDTQEEERREDRSEEKTENPAQKRKKKTPAWLLLLLLVFFVGIAIAELQVITNYCYEIYMEEETTFRNALEQRLLRKYSIYALSDWKNDFHMEGDLEKSNFRYGIIQTDDLDRVDLTDKNSYLINNFDENFDPKHVYWYSCTIGAETEFVYSFDWNYEDYVVSNAFTAGGKSDRAWIKGILYNRNTDSIYVIIENAETKKKELHLYLGDFQLLSPNPENIATSSEIETMQGDDNNYMVVVSVTSEDELQTMVSWNGEGWNEENANLRIRLGSGGSDTIVVPLREVIIANNSNIREFGELTDAPVIFFENGYAYCQLSQNSKANNYKDYYVLSYVADPIVTNGENNDLFSTMDRWITIAYNVRYLVLAQILLFFLIAGLLAVNLLIRLFGVGKNVFRIAFRAYRGSVPVFIRGSILLLLWGVLGSICIIFIYEALGARYIAVFWVVEKVILFPILLLFLVQINRVSKSSKSIAEGDMEHRIDTRWLVGDIKEMANNINSIGQGMNLAVDERMKSERFKTELITNVSHDIKTPLTSIVSYVDLLQKEDLQNEKATQYLEVLGRQSAKLKKLIEDLIEASKASTGNLSCVLQHCDVNVALIQMMGEYEEKLRSHQIQLITNTPETSVDIRIDQQHFPRVIDNLMSNIYKYAQPGTRAYVTLEKEKCANGGEQAVITFRNTSNAPLNISSEELLQRFARGDDSRNTEGNGLGLSIAQSLTELMGGTLELTVDGDLFKIQIRFRVSESTE